MTRPPWLTKDGSLDLGKFPIDGVLAQALRQDQEAFRSALTLLYSMQRGGRREAGIVLLGLLAECPDDWSKRIEIVKALDGFHTRGCAGVLFSEVRRVTSSNTTRRYLAAVLDALSSMPRELVDHELEILGEDTRFSYRMREKFRWLAGRAP